MGLLPRVFHFDSRESVTLLNATLKGITVNYGSSPADAVFTITLKENGATFVARNLSMGDQALLMNDERQGDPVTLAVERSALEGSGDGDTIEVLGLSTPRRTYLASATDFANEGLKMRIFYALICLGSLAGAGRIGQSLAKEYGSFDAEKASMDPFTIQLAFGARALGLKIGFFADVLEQESARLARLRERPATEKSAHIKAVNLLLQKGVSLDIKNSAGMSPLHIAASGGHVEAIDLLLRNGASVDLADRQGNTALVLAVSAGSLGAASKLIAAGASVLKKSAAGVPVSEIAGSARKKNAALADLLARSEAAQRSLFAAIERGDPDALLKALAAGAKANMPDENDRRPLELAVRLGSAPIVRKLIFQGAAVSRADCDIARRNGNAELTEILNAAYAKELSKKENAARAAAFEEKSKVIKRSS